MKELDRSILEKQSQQFVNNKAQWISANSLAAHTDLWRARLWGITFPEQQPSSSDGGRASPLLRLTGSVAT